MKACKGVNAALEESCQPEDADNPFLLQLSKLRVSCCQWTAMNQGQSRGKRVSVRDWISCLDARGCQKQLFINVVHESHRERPDPCVHFVCHCLPLFPHGDVVKFTQVNGVQVQQNALFSALNEQILYPAGKGFILEEADDGKLKLNDEDSECVRRCMLGNKLAASVDVHARL